MKKAILIAIAILAVFGITSCDNVLHNGTQVYITGIKVINIPAQYEGLEIYVHEGWMPGNAWDATTPNKAVVTGGEVDITFGTVATVTDATFGVQVIRTHWSDKVVAGLTDNMVNKYDSGTYKIVVDASDSTGSYE